MNYGCQSMVQKIDTILLKQPQAAYVSQENLDDNWKAFQYFGCPDFEVSIDGSLYDDWYTNRE